jgi:cobalt/nickel transport protein
MTTRTDSQPERSNTGIYVLGIILIVLLTAVPLWLAQGSEFGGADDQGSEAIASIAPDYDPTWISSIWVPPGGETESMLFALQAVAGGVLIGYFFGCKRGQKKASEQ